MRDHTLPRGDDGAAAFVPVRERVQEHLAPYLGDFNAEVWIKVVAERDLGLAPDELTEEHLDRLLEGLRASLNTFLGRTAAGELCQRITREVG